MPLFMLYAFVGPYLWALQAIAVVVLGALGWRATGGPLPAALQGRSAATLALALSLVFAVLVAPVALVIALRRNNREFPTSFTDPPGLVCLAQVLLVVAAGVNVAMVNRAR